MRAMLDERMNGSNAASSRSTRDPHHQLRVRAAWLYYVEGLTQSDVAKKLGVNRIMITRLLSEARARGEVIIRIKSNIAPLLELQRQLEEAFGLDQAIVAPFSDQDADPTRAIASAAGAYISELMTHNLTVGVGWGAPCTRRYPSSKAGLWRAFGSSRFWVESPRPDDLTRLSSLGSSPNSSALKASSSPPLLSSTRPKPSTHSWSIAGLSRS